MPYNFNTKILRENLLTKLKILRNIEVAKNGEKFSFNKKKRDNLIEIISLKYEFNTLNLFD